MLRVGLTGSIAVGKSHVLNTLAELGCDTIDADRIARDVVTPGSEGLRSIVNAFGEEVLKEHGMLDRDKLGAIVFTDEAKRKQLNSILHPIIIAAQDEKLREFQSNNPHGVVVVDAALMIESGGYKRFDKLIVVHCEPEIQLQRLMKRAGLSRDDAQKRIAAQMPQAEKMSHADFLIDTSGSFENTRAQTNEVYEKLRALADAH